MAIESGFFNSINRDRVYDARWFAQYFASFIGNGVFPNPSTGMQVTAGANMTTVVKAGKGWINGYFVINDSDYILQHDVADGVLKRVDRIVVRLDYLTRAIEVYVKKGTFASNPVGPALQRDGEVYELSLADVLINNGDTQISQSRITDTRMDNNLCGIVHGVVNQVDTTTLYQQYETFWNDYRNQRTQDFEDLINNSQQAFDNQTVNNQNTFDNQTMMNQQEFDTWFANVQDVLSGDVAGNLLNLINANTTKIDAVETSVSNTLSLIGNANGIASLDENSQVPANQLSNFLEVANPYRNSNNLFFTKREDFYKRDILIPNELKLFALPNQTSNDPISVNNNSLIQNSYKGINSSGYGSNDGSIYSSKTSNNQNSAYQTYFLTRELNFADIRSINFEVNSLLSSDVKIYIAIVRNNYTLVRDLPTQQSSDVLVPPIYLDLNEIGFKTTNYNLNSFNGIGKILIGFSDNGNVNMYNASITNINFDRTINQNPVKVSGDGLFSLPDNALSATFETVSINQPSDFEGWKSASSLEVLPNGTSVKYDLLDSLNNVIKSNYDNNKSFGLPKNSTAKLRVNLIRPNLNSNVSLSDINLIASVTQRYGEVKIAEITLTNNASEINFQDLELETYESFRLVSNFRYSSSQGLFLNFNDITTNSYNFTGSVTGGAAAVGTTSNRGNLPITWSTNNLVANGKLVCEIYNYEASDSGVVISNGTIDGIRIFNLSGSWNINQLVNKIKLSAPFLTNTKVTLYGVKRNV